jgi:hypothetical protein
MYIFHSIFMDYTLSVTHFKEAICVQNDYFNMLGGQEDINSIYNMQQCIYPYEYQQSFGGIYSNYMMDNMQSYRYGDMMCYYMYPDIYYKIYPYAAQVCDKMDNLYMTYPSQQLLENMVDECYDICIKKMPELEEYASKADEVTVSENEVEEQQVIRRRAILRDLIAIILISELFRRRRRFYPWDAYGYNDYLMY